MYNKNTIKKTKTEFYTSFGRFMAKHRSLQGNKVNWINYNSGVRHLYIRLEANQKSAIFSIDLQHKDEDIRELFYEQFLALKTVFHQTMGNELIWIENHKNETENELSRIYIELNNINIYDKSTWKKAFKFFEEYLLKFDEFWAEFKDLFSQMQ